MIDANPWIYVYAKIRVCFQDRLALQWFPFTVNIESDIVELRL